MKTLVENFFLIQNLQKIKNIKVKKAGIANLKTGEKFNQNKIYIKQNKYIKFFFLNL